MERSRPLHLVKESLTRLETEELRLAVAAGTFEATEPCNPCIVSWSCDDIKTYRCLQTRLCG